MTQHIIIATAALSGMLSVIFGAFGAHALKKILSTEQLHSFDVGVKYQMYHAIVLLTSRSKLQLHYFCYLLVLYHRGYIILF